MKSPYWALSYNFPYNPDPLCSGNNYNIYDEMIDDDQVKSVISIKKDMVVNTGWKISGDNEEVNEFITKCFEDVTIRLSLYSRTGSVKSFKSIQELGKKRFPIEICFMVSRETTADELLATAMEVERDFNCNVFFISSIRELDNPRKEFFDDTALSMPVIEYKEHVHNFLNDYDGDMEIHVSK